MTFGDGNNVVDLQGGDDVFKAGTDDNTVTGGAGQDDMTIAADRGVGLNASDMEIHFVALATFSAASIAA